MSTQLSEKFFSLAPLQIPFRFPSTHEYSLSYKSAPQAVLRVSTHPFIFFVPKGKSTLYSLLSIFYIFSPKKKSPKISQKSPKISQKSPKISQKSPKISQKF